MELQSNVNANENRALQLLSVVIPARDEEGCIVSRVEHLHVELRSNQVPHETVVVDDGGSDRAWQVLQEARQRISEFARFKNLDLTELGERSL
jgi:dolichol-phosphate mannosyltransferase